jgi:hypothetical protein
MYLTEQRGHWSRCSAKPPTLHVSHSLSPTRQAGPAPFPTRHHHRSPPPTVLPWHRPRFAAEPSPSLPQTVIFLASRGPLRASSVEIQIGEGAVSRDVDRCRKSVWWWGGRGPLLLGPSERGGGGRMAAPWTSGPSEPLVSLVLAMADAASTSTSWDAPSSARPADVDLLLLQAEPQFVFRTRRLELPPQGRGRRGRWRGERGRPQR